MENGDRTLKTRGQKTQIVDSVPFPGVATIHRSDLEVEISGGFIVHASFGSLAYLRDLISEKLGKKNLIYFTISGKDLYLVHWNDLNKDKQKSLGGKELNWEKKSR